MWSMCSIETGHSCTHAPQVTQSQTTSSVTAFGTSGESSPPARAALPSANSWSRIPMIRSFGESAFPVANAGQTSWQRPHSVQDTASSICFHVRSAIVPAPKRIRRLVLRLEVEGLEAAARPRPAEEDVDRRRRDVQVLRVREVREEAENDQHVRPDEDALEHLGRRVVREETRERVRHGRPVGRPGFSPSAMRVACQRSSVVTMPGDQREDEVGLAQMAPFEPARSLDLPDPERHDDADQDENGEHVDEERVPALALEPAERRRRGNGSSRSTIAATAMKIVGKRTRKPQKMKACTRPGTSRCKSFLCPRTIAVSLPTRRGTSDTRSTALPDRTSRVRNSARRAKRKPATAIAATRATADATLAVVLSLWPSAARPRSPGRPRGGRRSRRSRRSPGWAPPGRC